MKVGIGNKSIYFYLFSEPLDHKLGWVLNWVNFKLESIIGSLKLQQLYFQLKKSTAVIKIQIFNTDIFFCSKFTSKFFFLRFFVCLFLSIFRCCSHFVDFPLLLQASCRCIIYDQTIFEGTLCFRDLAKLNLLMVVWF